LAGIFVAMVLGCGGGGSADLKLNLKQGETYRTRIVTEQVVSQAGRGQSESVSQKITQDMACELLETDSQGKLHVKVTFERMAEEMARGAMKQTYDSADPNSSNLPTAMKYSPFVGHALTLVVSDRGELAEVTGVDSLIDRILGVMDIQVDSLRDQMRTLLQGDYSRQLSGELCDKLFGALPSASVKVGDSWNRATEGKIVIPLTWQHALKLTALDKGVATLTDSASTSIDTQDNPEDMGMVTISRVATGSQSGTLEVDAATGMITGGTVTGALKGEQHIVDGPEQIKGQTIPLDVTQTITWAKL
jgi:hypothetical protein